MHGVSTGISSSIFHWQVCVLLNNIEHVRQVLKSIPEQLQLTKFMQWLDSKEVLAMTGPEDTQKLSESTVTLFNKLLVSADEDMHNKISIQVNRIVRKVCL